jgi:hypothetical protein
LFMEKCLCAESGAFKMRSAAMLASARKVVYVLCLLGWC